MIREIKYKDLKTEYPLKRDCYKELQDYIYGEPTHRVCALYGLRRTGKSVMIEQMIKDLHEKNIPFKYYYCENDESTIMTNLKELLDDDLKNGIKYVFVDEITNISNFQNGCASLSDFYAKQGMKIVIAGTDSLGIAFASMERLYDRLKFIHTSYISFGEFSRLLDKGINEYIEYGGTLTNMAYKDLQNTDEYYNTAIVNNILHSIENSEGMRIYPPALTELYENEDIVSAINKIISKFSQVIALKAIRKQYKNGPMNATIRNIERSDYPADYRKMLNIEKVVERTRQALQIHDNIQTRLKDAHLSELKSYLYKLDLYLSIPSYESLKRRRRKDDVEIITQPGMIYCHSTTLINALMENDSWAEDCQIEDRNYFGMRADGFVRGFILENEVLANTYINFSDKRFYVSKLSMQLENTYLENEVHDFNYLIRAEDGSHCEADMIIKDHKKNITYLFEVKLSDKPMIKHEKHLSNKGFVKYIGNEFAPVERKYVLYNGENGMHNDIQYVNVEDYLNIIYENNKDFDKVINILDDISKNCIEIEGFVDKKAVLDDVVYNCEQICKNCETNKKMNLSIKKDEHEIE